MRLSIALISASLLIFNVDIVRAQSFSDPTSTDEREKLRLDSLKTQFPKRQLIFSIPAQPLPEALAAFGSATGFEIFYDGAIAVGRHSNSVEGAFVAEEALRRMLVGTGLFARLTTPTTAIIDASSPARSSASTFQPYFAMIQKQVSETLCAHTDTRPGEVDVLLHIWIASSGRIERVRMPDAPSGLVAARFSQVLSGVEIGTPPAGLPQPVTMAVLAHRGKVQGCRPLAAGAL